MRLFIGYRSLVRWGVLVGFGAALGGCSFLSDYGGLAGGPSAAADATPDGPSSPAGDATFDDASSSCAGAFCDDFDGSGALTAKWGTYRQGSGVTAGADETNFRSPPRAFRTKAVGPGAFMLIHRRTAPTSASVIRFEGAFSVEAPPTASGDVVTLLIYKRLGTGTEGVELQVDDKGLRVSVGGTRTALGPLPPGWFRVRLDMRLHPSEGSFEVAIDGNVVATKSGLASATVSATEQELLVGLLTHDAVSTTARLDDVKIGWR